MRRTNCSLYLFGLILSFFSWPALCGTVYKTILREGQGQVPTVNQTVIVHYTGTLPSGTKFDSSHDRNEPFKFKLGVGEVIRGWDAGVITMRVGERARLEISSEDAYGAEGMPPVIPPSSKLIFDIELLGVEGGASPPTVQVQNIPPVQSQTQSFPGAPQGFTQPGQSFSTGQGQSFGSDSSQGRIFTPPDLPNLSGQGQEFRGSNIRQNEVFPQPQQSFSSVGQGQSFGSNPSQGQQFPNSPPPGLTFASNQLQGQTGASSQSQGQGFSGNSFQGQTFGNSPPPARQPFGPPENQGQSFGTNQVQTFNPPNTGGNPPMNQPPIGSIQNNPRPRDTFGDSRRDFGSSSQGNTQPFGNQFPSPSQDISRMNPVLLQGRPEPVPSQSGRQDFNNFPRSSSPSSSTQQNSPNFPGRSDQFGSGFAPGGMPRGLPPPAAQPNSFRTQPDANRFPQSPFGNSQGTSSGGRVPDLDSVRGQSVDLRPRFPGGTDGQFGSQRDILGPPGREFSQGAGTAGSMFDRAPSNEFSNPRLTNRLDQTRMDPSTLRGEVGLDPAFPSMFSRRDFRTGTRGIGGVPPSDFFGSRGGAAFGGESRRFPEIDARTMRGFPRGGFRRPRDPMMIMMMERARRARRMRGF